MAFTYVEFVQPNEPWYSVLSFVVALAAVFLLLALGFSREGLRLRFAPLSRTGALLLLAATALMLPILGSSTEFVGLRWLPALPVALLVACVISLAGIAWGRQVQHDRTVVWAIAQHSLFLVVMSMFDWA